MYFILVSCVYFRFYIATKIVFLEVKLNYQNCYMRELNLRPRKNNTLKVWSFGGGYRVRLTHSFNYSGWHVSVSELFERIGITEFFTKRLQILRG